MLCVLLNIKWNWGTNPVCEASAAKTFSSYDPAPMVFHSKSLCKRKHMKGLRESK